MTTTTSKRRVPAPQVTRAIMAADAARDALHAAEGWLESWHHRQAQHAAEVERHELNRTGKPPISHAEALEYGSGAGRDVQYHPAPEPEERGAAEAAVAKAADDYLKASKAAEKAIAEHPAIDPEQAAREAGCTFYALGRIVRLGGVEYVRGEAIPFDAFITLPWERQDALLRSRRVGRVRQ